MELVIEKEIFKIYLDLLTPNSKDEKEIDLIIAVESSENRIKISSKYLELIEQYLKINNPEYLNYFQTFIISLNDKNRIISFKSSINTNNEHILLKEIFDFNNVDYTFILSKSPLNIKDNEYINCSYDNVNKPNKDWFLLSLLTTRLVSISPHYFSNKSELEKIFEICSKIPRSNKNLHIIDSYFSLYPTSIQKLFKGYGFKFKCYTSSYLKNDSQKDNIRQRLKQEFGKQTAIKFSSNKRVLHERKIILGKLVIDLTHDFSEITLSNNNWTVYFIINEKTSEYNMNKLSKYN